MSADPRRRFHAITMVFNVVRLLMWGFTLMMVVWLTFLGLRSMHRTSGTAEDIQNTTSGIFLILLLYVSVSVIDQLFARIEGIRQNATGISLAQRTPPPANPAQDRRPIGRA